jgi:hypothetical protein
MRTGRAIPTGTAFAVTVGIGYTACALVFRLWPEAALVFMNSLFHGLDFRKLQAVPGPFDFGGFLVALAGIVVWAFLMGALFGWIVDRLRPVR